MKLRRRVLIVAGASLMYVLSSGPVTGFFLANNPHPDPVIEIAAVVVYSPLSLLTGYWPPAEKTLYWYCDLFCPREDDGDEDD
jgi:hypothetical protein